MSFAAVLFDLDGTLLDTLADLGNSVNRVLAAHGFPTHPLDAYRNYVGDGIVKLIQRAVPPGQHDAQVFQSCLQAYREDYGRNWNVDTRAYPLITQMLDELLARKIKLAVLSNKPDEFTQLCVRHYFSRWQFDAVLGASAAFAHKPDPASALDIARRLDVPPSEFLYLGDTATDMQTAANAGMTPVGALWGFRTQEELQTAGAKILTAHPADLLRHLNA